MKWQPIETHNKDAKYFLIALGDLSIKQKRYLKPIDIARWDGHFYRDKLGNFLDDYIIKGWMPLPEPPKED